MNMTHTGEQGFVLYIPNEFAVEIYDSIMEAGKLLQLHSIVNDDQSFSALVKICCARAHLEILVFALAIFQAHERALALLANERRSFFALI